MHRFNQLRTKGRDGQLWLSSSMRTIASYKGIYFHIKASYLARTCHSVVCMVLYCILRNNAHSNPYQLQICPWGMRNERLAFKQVLPRYTIPVLCSASKWRRSKVIEVTTDQHANAIPTICAQRRAYWRVCMCLCVSVCVSQSLCVSACVCVTFGKLCLILVLCVWD